MLISEKPVIFVGAVRNKGISKKSGNEYDFATIEISDGIGSIEMPLRVDLAETLNHNLNRGDKIKIRVDARKNFGRTEFLVDHVDKV